VGSEVEIDNTFFNNLINTQANKMPGMGVLMEKYKQILAYRDFLSSSYVLALADLPFLVLFMVAILVFRGPWCWYRWSVGADPAGGRGERAAGAGL